MNKHVNERFRSLLHGHFNIPRDVDHFAREEAMRERAKELQLMAHPDSRDPDYPGDEDES